MTEKQKQIWPCARCGDTKKVPVSCKECKLHRKIATCPTIPCPTIPCPDCQSQDNGKVWACDKHKLENEESGSNGHIEYPKCECWKFPEGGYPCKPIERNVGAEDYPDCVYGDKGSTCIYGRKMNSGVYKCARYPPPRKDVKDCYWCPQVEVQKLADHIKKVKTSEESEEPWIRNLDTPALVKKCYEDIRDVRTAEDPIQITRLRLIIARLDKRLEAETKRAESLKIYAGGLENAQGFLDERIVNLEAKLKAAREELEKEYPQEHPQ